MSELRTTFGRLWSEKYQTGYVITGKDQQAIADARRDMPAEVFEALPGLVGRFLAMADKFLTPARHPLFAMFMRVNELRAKGPKEAGDDWFKRAERATDERLRAQGLLPAAKPKPRTLRIQDENGVPLEEDAPPPRLARGQATGNALVDGLANQKGA